MVDYKEFKEEIINFYEYFVQKLTSNPNYKFKLSIRNEIILKNFLKLFEKRGVKIESLGKDWLFNYFCLQFEYFRGKYTHRGKNEAQFSWIIGSEAYKRWFNKSKDWEWWCREGIIKFHNIKKEDLIKAPTLEFFEYEYPEIRKQQNLGLCLLGTFLFNHKYASCINCSQKEECLKFLKNKYPKIYKNRGYETNKIKPNIQEKTNSE